MRSVLALKHNIYSYFKKIANSTLMVTLDETKEKRKKNMNYQNIIFYLIKKKMKKTEKINFGKRNVDILFFSCFFYFNVNIFHFHFLSF